MRRATAIRVDDGISIIIRPNTVVKLAGLTPPDRGTPEAASAKEKLEALVLGKKVEFETLQWDRLGRSIARVKVEGIDLNAEMARFMGSSRK
ncbi:MAG: thermonuclease family protein [Candidatus Bathyarchaeota archaeon]|jgi:endonuclease YncB( thermonuclease family)